MIVAVVAVANEKNFVEKFVVVIVIVVAAVNDVNDGDSDDDVAIADCGDDDDDCGVNDVNAVERCSFRLMAALNRLWLMMFRSIYSRPWWLSLLLIFVQNILKIYNNRAIKEREREREQEREKEKQLIKAKQIEN